ncbi:hypothetical protein [Stieleria varia]|uniref:Uncharacterized protein n=1 Tax=Stieleria varia TaxID=2528005 RepID=A0A5C6BBF1_9BACT|nr:hypothetical protein [Stieleria varia]TWU07854.1 hypothetical protein Pla52n_04300 [Stieleria varia]
MRIPSQFNDQSLYRSSDRRSKSAATSNVDTFRRLMRLGVALILVLVVMQQAAKPRLYQVFFGTGGNSWTSTAAPLERGDSAVGDAIATDTQIVADPNPNEAISAKSAGPNPQDSGLVSPDPQTQQIADGLVEKMSVADQRRLATYLTGNDSADAPALDAETIGQWRDAFAQVIETTKIPDADLSGFPQVIADALLISLDKAAMDRVADGTFWRADDADAFYLQLNQSDSLTAQGTSVTGTRAPVTGTLPLLQQPDAYRGQRVQIVGKIGLAESLPAKSNGLGIKSYWQLWVVPSDGGKRPIVLITKDLPDSIRTALDEDGKWDASISDGTATPEITAVGRFIKRLPYRSSIGADLAPVVIGRIIAQKTLAPTVADSTNAKRPPRQVSLLWIVLGAIVAGVSIAGAVMYRTAVAARETRRRRVAGRPDANLQFDQIKPTKLEADDDAGNNRPSNFPGVNE